ncbi:Oligopeptide transporter 3 [Hordeum vulgare]|nr:Oligopeptide transporter 3 [Hordeum vulgare]
MAQQVGPATTGSASAPSCWTRQASWRTMVVGFAMFIYVIVPLCYWRFNTFDARRFPIFSNKLFTCTGQKYDNTKVLTSNIDLNIAAYVSYGKLYLSPLFAIPIGSGFLRFSSTIVHVLLFHGADMWRQSRRAIDAAAKLDVHARLMQRYKQLLQWWFLVLLAGSIHVLLLMCFVWKEQVQLPWWGMLFAFALAFVVTCCVAVRRGDRAAGAGVAAEPGLPGEEKYNYVLLAALDAGTAFMGVLIFFVLQNTHHDLKWWGTEVDHCPPATCPTAPDIVVKGCPVF